MFKQKIIITAQYYENYADNPEKDKFWKPKGAAQFLIKAETEKQDILVFDLDENAIREILLEKSNNHVKYEYIDHERVFSEPRNISEAYFEKAEKNLRKLGSIIS